MAREVSRKVARTDCLPRKSEDEGRGSDNASKGSDTFFFVMGTSS
jgi:hypothetical protein